MPNFWTIRTGRAGERTDWALTNNVVGGGWVEVPDLAQFQSKEELREFLTDNVGGSKNRIANYTGQLWAMSKTIAVGDYMVLPIRSAAQIAIGKVAGPYTFVSDEPDETKRHQIPVNWIVKDIPKSVIKQDLLYQLGSALTVFKIGNNDAAYRLEQVLAGKPDPGIRLGNLKPPSSIEDVTDAGDQSESGQSSLDIEEIARDDIARLLQQEFKGHDLAALVEELLTAEGFKCKRSPEGSDGGVDVIAGMGMLGMDSPKLVVQVKSQPQPVSDTVLQQLNGAIHRFQADQALLVSYGGVTAPAKKFLASQPFTVSVWETQDIMDAVLKHYDRLAGDTRARLPLKQIWVPVPNESSE